MLSAISDKNKKMGIYIWANLYYNVDISKCECNSQFVLELDLIVYSLALQDVSLCSEVHKQFCLTIVQKRKIVKIRS